MLEYKIFDTTNVKRPDTIQSPQDYQRWLEQEFEKLSADGWELAACDGTKYFFKRPKAVEQSGRNVGFNPPGI